MIVSMKMAKASEKDIENLREFLEIIEEYIEKAQMGVLDSEEEDILRNHIQENFPNGWRRVVSGYEVLFENCCDPTLDYLDFKPELKEKTQ